MLRKINTLAFVILFLDIIILIGIVIRSQIINHLPSSDTIFTIILVATISSLVGVSCVILLREEVQ